MTDKTIMEMTETELREEIGRLGTALRRVTEKNKRRKKALKEMNKSVFITGRLKAETMRLNDNQRRLILQWKARAELAEEQVQELHKYYEDQLKEMATYAHGREMQAQAAGFTKPEHGHIYHDTPVRESDETDREAGTKPGWKPDVAKAMNNHTKKGFFSFFRRKKATTGV